MISCPDFPTHTRVNKLNYKYRNSLDTRLVSCSCMLQTYHLAVCLCSPFISGKPLCRRTVPECPPPISCVQSLLYHSGATEAWGGCGTTGWAASTAPCTHQQLQHQVWDRWSWHDSLTLTVINQCCSLY